MDENRYRLLGVLPATSWRLRWNYDFGDGWEHDVVVEEVGQVEAGVEYPFCLAGSRACPPEDCGGPSGYALLLAALADPNHPEHEELKMWAPPDFDPAHCDSAEATSAMRTPRPVWE